MGSPTNMDLMRLKRIGRYLIGRPTLVILYRWQKVPDHISAFSDSDWAGDPDSRKSVSAGVQTKVLMPGRHVINVWTKTQSVIATSSCESELYAFILPANERRPHEIAAEGGH